MKHPCRDIWLFLFINDNKINCIITAQLYHEGFHNERRPLLSDSEQGRLSRDDYDHYYSPEGIVEFQSL